MAIKKTPSNIDILPNASIEKIQKIFKNEQVRMVGKSFHICIARGSSPEALGPGQDARGNDQADEADNV